MKRAYQKFNLRQIFLLIAVSAISFISKAQPVAAYGDPAVGSFDVTTTSDISISANSLMSNTVYKLKLDIHNFDMANSIPLGTCQMWIGLGSKLKVDPAFNMATAPGSNYFTWIPVTSGGQVQIYGILHTPLPADYHQMLSFNVRAVTPATQGNSTITGIFQVPNNNPLYNFSDLNPTNNNASIQYAMAAQIPLPVNITKFSATHKNCQVNINWSVEQENNLSRYEVEMSKDGINFFKVGTVQAQNKTDYSTSIAITDAIKATTLYVRLKSIDLDNSFKYSSIVSVAGTCGGKMMGTIYGYPNPVNRGSSYISIGVRDGMFNGEYQLSLTDIAGKTYGVKTINLVNTITFQYDIPTVIAPGKYFISIRKVDSDEKGLLQFEKL